MPSPPETKPRLLCVDDYPLQHRIIEHLVSGFRQTSFDCEFASTYDDGLVKLVNGGYSVCLLDHKLDRGNGIDMLSEARRLSIDTPIIMMTVDDTGRRHRCRRGRCRFLLKAESTRGC
jgi:DNA-binding response OmpR family regulator